MGRARTAIRAPNSATLDDIVVPALCWSPVGVAVAEMLAFVAVAFEIVVELATAVELASAAAGEASSSRTTSIIAKTNRRL